MKQRIFLDLTPLLDVVLILLFAFMLNMHVSSSQRDTELEKQTAKNQTLSDAVTERNEQISALAKELQHAKDQQQKLEEEISQMVSTMDVERESIEAIAGQLSKWFGDTSLKTIADEKMIEKFLDKNTIYEELYKYDTLAKRYFFVDIKLQTSDNEILINDTHTRISITREDILSNEKLDFKRDQLLEAIEKVLNDRQGGYTFVLITLSQEGNVYRIAYNLVWDVIEAIETKYGADKIFKTKYKSPSGT